MKRLFVLAAIAALTAACADEAETTDTESAPTADPYSLGWSWIPQGYTDDIRDGWPDFGDSEGRWDGTFERDCSGTEGVQVFACVEQRFWQAFQFEPSDRVATYEMMTELLAELEADRDRTDDMSLAMVYFRRMLLSVLLLAEEANGLGLNEMIPDISRSVELVPDNAPFRSWRDTMLVMITAATGNDGLGIDIDEVMEENELAAHEDPIALYNFLLTGASLPMQTGWPERAVQLLDDILYAADGDGANAISAASRDREQMRTPHWESGVAFAAGEMYARAGRRDDALREWNQALAYDVDGDWSFRDYTQALVDDIDGVIGEFEALGDDENAFTLLRVQNEASCTPCHGVSIRR